MECLAGRHLPPPTTSNELARVVHLTLIGRIHRRVGARSCPFKLCLEPTWTRMNFNPVSIIVISTLKIRYEYLIMNISHPEMAS